MNASSQHRAAPKSTIEPTIGSTEPPARARSQNVAFWITVILSLALVLRLSFMLVYSESANLEGIYYLRIAENLAAGRGYLGLHENGPQILYPPLFPGMIALGTALFGHAELVARIINVVLGTALVAPIFLIARLIADDRSAMLAALLAAIHPYLIAMSTVILSETAYMLLILTGLYGVVSSSGTYPLRRVVLAGLCFGLAYLVRPEGLIFGVLGMVGLVVMHLRHFRLGLRMAGVFALSMALLATPYVLWLSLSVGQFLLESKSADNYAQKSELIAHVNPGEIYFAINDDLSPKGLSMISNAEAIRRWKVTPFAAAAFAVSTWRQSTTEVIKHLATSRALGGPILSMFALLGLARGLRRREAWFGHAGLAAIMCGTTFALFLAPTQSFLERYLFPCLPPLLIWCASGITCLSTWMEKICGTTIASSPKYRPLIIRWTVIGLVGLLLTASSISALRDIADLREGWGENRTEKEVGLWLRDHAGKEHSRVMVANPTAAYYAGGGLIPFPYTTSARALAFIDAQGVDFVILSTRSSGARPYIRDWIEHGVPDGRAKVVYKISDPLEGEDVVYRWTPLAP